jgi:nitrite reductase/ring-hydroxylating ferredoxin subunit
MAPPPDPAPDDWTPICRLADLADGRGLALDLDGRRLAVFQVAGSVHVLSGICPHAGGAMGKGWVEDCEAVCPLHRWRFRLTDGRCTTIRGERLRVFPCRVQDGQVLARL